MNEKKEGRKKKGPALKEGRKGRKHFLAYATKIFIGLQYVIV